MSGLSKDPFEEEHPTDGKTVLNPGHNRPDELTRHFHKMWNDLHVEAQWWPEKPSIRRILQGKKFLREFRERLPDDCPCKGEWDEALKDCPPPLEEGGDSYFWWTIALHDRVNVILGKKVWATRSKKHKLLQDISDPKNRLKTPGSNVPF